MWNGVCGVRQYVFQYFVLMFTSARPVDSSRDAATRTCTPQHAEMSCISDGVNETNNFHCRFAGVPGGRRFLVYCLLSRSYHLQQSEGILYALPHLSHAKGGCMVVTSCRICICIAHTTFAGWTPPTYSGCLLALPRGHSR